MSFKQRLLGGFGAMLALGSVLGVGSMLVTRDLSQDMNRAVNVTGREQYLAGVINAGASEMASCERAGVLATVLGDKGRAEEYQGRFSTAAGAMEKALAEMGRVAETGESRTQLEGIEQQARLVLISGAKLAVIGVLIGLAGAAAASSLLRSFLFQVSPFDPRVLALAAIAVFALALLASALPARRAAAVDPIEVLRGN